jgi:hypothetical protein
MEIPVVVEKIKGNGYRARSAEPVAVSARGATRDAALGKLREKIHNRLSKGTELVSLAIDTPSHPLAKYAGMFRDDPIFESVLAIMADNRRKMDEDPKVP